MAQGDVHEFLARTEALVTADVVLERLLTDLEQLSAIERRTTTAGERRSAAWVAARLRETGAEDVRVVRFRGQSTWAWTLILHAAAGIVATAGRSRARRLLAAGTAASLEADLTGRSQWSRRLIPAGEGSNVIARLPSRGPARRTLVLVAHHDAAHTGLIWHRRALEPGRKLARRTGNTPPYSLPVQAALALATTRSRLGRRAARWILALTALTSIQAAYSRTVPGASDNATGVSGLLELARRLARDRPAGTEVILLSPGGEEAGLVGMSAWMRSEGRKLDPSTTLVLGLDTLGAGEPVVVRKENFTAYYRTEDLELADLAARAAGLAPPARVGIGPSTDPIVARVQRIPAISILSMRSGAMGEIHRPTDTPHNVDLKSVERCTRLAHSIIHTWVLQHSNPPAAGDRTSRLRGNPRLAKR